MKTYQITEKQLEDLECAIRGFDREYDEVEEVIDLLRDVKGEEHYKELYVEPFCGPPTLSQLQWQKLTTEMVLSHIRQYSFFDYEAMSHRATDDLKYSVEVYKRDK